MIKTYSALLLALFASLGSPATIVGPGACRDDVPTQEGFNYSQFAAENDGVWSTQMTIEDVEWMFEVILSAQIPGVTENLKFLKQNGSAPQVVKRTLAHFDSNGRLTEYGRKGVTVYRTFIKYVPRRYAFYFVCSDQNAPVHMTSEVDYRFLVSNVELTAEEKAEVLALDKKYNFKGNLKMIEALN